MTTEQITALATLLGGEQTKPATEGSVWEVGKTYYLQTVTWAYTGTLVAVTDNELLLKQAALIGDTGPFHKALKSEEFEEVEPLVNDLVIGRYSIVSATQINHPQLHQK
jgi:hypothetical protein